MYGMRPAFVQDRETPGLPNALMKRCLLMRRVD
jgi:hypothetical protein